MKKGFIYLLFAALLNASVAAQQSSPTPQKDELPLTVQQLNEFNAALSKRINFFAATGNALTRLEEARAVALDYPPETHRLEYGLLTETLKQFSASVGNYADAIRFADFTERKYADNPNAADTLAGFRPLPAVKAIAEAAANRQIVIVNEAHDVPQHRAFTFELLKSLKKKGFKYFAAEALFNRDGDIEKTDAELNARGYPTKKSGNYMEEPVYGDIIRAALRLGYKVIAYDGAFGKNGRPNKPAAREREAAENLQNRIFKTDPKAKVLIHVGYAHNSEAANVYGSSPSMAGNLRDLTGIDGLTIDQTLMTEHSAPEYEAPLYRAVSARKNFKQPAVFRNARGEFWKPKTIGQDIAVFSPRSVYLGGRPTWLELSGARKRYVLPPDVCGSEKHCLARARFGNESADAVPVDQIEARAGAKNVLLLPKGGFVIEIENAAGANLKTLRVNQ